MVSKEELVICCLLLVVPGVKGETGLAAVIIAAVVSVLLLAILIFLIGMLYYWRGAIDRIDRHRAIKELANRKRKKALSQQSIIANEKRQAAIGTNSRPPSEHSTRFITQKEPSERSLQMHPTPNFSDKANAWIQENPTSGYDVKERVINFDDEEDVIITEVLDNDTTTRPISQSEITVTGRNTVVDNKDEPLSRLSQRQSNLAASGVEMTSYDDDAAVVNLRASRMEEDSMVLY